MIEGLVGVDVDSNAQTEYLDLDLLWTSCGLAYMDREMCPQNEFEIDALRGQVLDPTGAAIPGANILVFDGGGESKLTEKLQTDEAGKFASLHRLSGSYELQIDSAGFTDLRVKVHLQPGATIKSSQTLSLALGLFGSCGISKIEEH